jgi:hypothetical protein
MPPPRSAACATSGQDEPNRFPHFEGFFARTVETFDAQWFSVTVCGDFGRFLNICKIVNVPATDPENPHSPLDHMLAVTTVDNEKRT